MGDFELVGNQTALLLVFRDIVLEDFAKLFEGEEGGFGVEEVDDKECCVGRRRNKLAIMI